MTYQPHTTPEPAAWRYQDARGHYRYRGYKPGFDKEYSLLRPVPLYLADPPVLPAPLSDAEIETLAHRKAWRYKKSSDPHHSDTYTFNRSTLIEFVRAAASIGAET